MSEGKKTENLNKDNINHGEQTNTYYTATPKFSKQGTSKLRQHFNRGATAFFVVAASIMFYFALLRVTNLTVTFELIFDALKPVIYGCIIAYLLNPIVKKIDYKLVPFLEKRIKDKKKVRKISRSVGIIASLVFLFALITLLCNLLIPELYKSIRNLIFTLPSQLNQVIYNLNNIELKDSAATRVLRTVIEEGTTMFQSWLRTDLMEQVNEIMTNLTEGVLNVLSELFDFLVGVIVSVYVMFNREEFARQSKKAVYALFEPRRANLILHLSNKSHDIFCGFIIGKIIDSIIIGIICFAVLSVLQMPYTVLVSVIVGVTNVIPFFGPFIGAIPCSILILLNDPMKGVYFIIFILLLQQFDGNILGPKILGDSTGLSSFWVIVAILFGGGLFGFAGMLMGVPTFAVIYYIVQMLINDRLEKKNLPTHSRHYHTMSYVDEYGRFRYSPKKKPVYKEPTVVTPEAVQAEHEPRPEAHK